MSAEDRRRLRALLGEVAGEGTDHDGLLAVLSFVVRPRCAPDALRRRCLADGVDGAAPASRAAAAAGPPDASLAHAVGPVLTAWREAGVRVALIGDPTYPRRLAEGWPITEAPTLLAWRGRPPTEAAAVALVGARRATGYGAGVTAWLAASVARLGVRVVSGGAVGVDAAAHGAALEEQGGTTVVLGCGHGVAYPRPHATPGGLFDRVVERGGSILSELLPWQLPKAGTVRARNRIVAGLSDVVVVVEGGARSGALVTATAAADRGVPVLAVPGDVRAPGSAAPHRLLAEGAAPCTTPADILEALPAALNLASGPGVTERTGEVVGPTSAGPTTGGGPVDTAGAGVRRGGLPPAVHDALAAAWPRPLRVDDLAARTGHALPALLAAITRARVAGTVAEGPDGVRLRRAP
jgi:DNA processing protein